MPLPELDNNFLLHLSSIFSFLAAFIILIFTVPLQLKQAQVKNGLAKLRRKLLGLGITLFITNLVVAIVLLTTSIRIVSDPRIISTLWQLTLLLLTSGKLIASILLYQIYHEQYTPEQIEHSKRNARIEKAEELRSIKNK